MRIKFYFSTWLLFVGTVAVKSQSLYVDASKQSSSTGTSWATAYKTLSEALDAAWQDPNITNVYVAKGSYAPSNYPYTMGASKVGTQVTSATTGYTLTSYDKTFHIRTGLEVYGGYPPGGGTRNISANETILNGNSTCYHVVLMDSSANWAATTDTTIVDGFTITGGYADGISTYNLNGSAITASYGGGFYISTGIGKLSHNLITANSSYFFTSGTQIGAYGGGVYTNAQVFFAYNIFSGNTAYNYAGGYGYGGAVYATKSTYFLNNSIVNNLSGASSGGGLGGGVVVVAVDNSVVTTMMNNVIANNKVSGITNSSCYGGGVCFYRSNAILTNNVIAGNSVDGGKSGFSTNLGGGIFTTTGIFTFNNNTIVGNTCNGSGGAITSVGNSSTINTFNNCIIWNNTATRYVDIYNSGATMFVKNSLIQLTSSSYTYNNANQIMLASPDKNLYATDPLFVNANNIAGLDGIYGTSDDGLALQSSSPAMNTGNNYLVPVDVTTDITNNPRIQNSTVDMGAYEAPATVLPLQLLGFSGVRQGNANLLQWTTGNEVGTKSFIVESSANASNFSPIDNVGATGGGKYSLTDNNPLATRTYYRLKILDADGKFTYSNIIWINNIEPSNISLYPNPATQAATLNIGNNFGLIGTQAQLIDLNGRAVKQITIAHNQEQFDMTLLQAGIYTLKLKDGSVIKIFKQ